MQRFLWKIWCYVCVTCVTCLLRVLFSSCYIYTSLKFFVEALLLLEKYQQLHYLYKTLGYYNRKISPSISVQFKKKHHKDLIIDFNIAKRCNLISCKGFSKASRLSYVFWSRYPAPGWPNLKLLSAERNFFSHNHSLFCFVCCLCKSKKFLSDYPKELLIKYTTKNKLYKRYEISTLCDFHLILAPYRFFFSYCLLNYLLFFYWSFALFQ